MSIITANNFAAVMIFLEVASDRCWLQKAEERGGVIIWVIICRLYILEAETFSKTDPERVQATPN